MARGAMVEGAGDGAPWPLGADPGCPTVSRGPPSPRGEVGGQERFLYRPQGEREVVERARGQILQDGVRRLDKSKSPHLSPGVYDVFGLG